VTAATLNIASHQQLEQRAAVGNAAMHRSLVSAVPVTESASVTRQPINPSINQSNEQLLLSAVYKIFLKTLAYVCPRIF